MLVIASQNQQHQDDSRQQRRCKNDIRSYSHSSKNAKMRVKVNKKFPRMQIFGQKLFNIALLCKLFPKKFAKNCRAPYLCTRKPTFFDTFANKHSRTD